MPWSIAKRGDEYCVIKDSDGTSEGCHPTRAAAIKHQRALYANESAATAEADTLSDVDKFVMPSGFTLSDPVTGNSTTYTMTVAEADVDASDEADVATTEEFEGPLAILGHPTSDMRYLIPGEVSHRELPLPLMVQTATAEGHDGAEVAGRIEKIEFIAMSDFDRGDEFNLGAVTPTGTVVWGEGRFDGSPASAEAKRLIENGAGVSIDIPTDRMALIDPDTLEEVDPETVEMEDVLSGKYLTGLAGKIAGATVVTIGAFEEAVVQLTEGHALVAAAYGMCLKDSLIHQMKKLLVEEMHKPADSSATLQTLIASAAPLKPPREWFEDPGLPKLTPLTITDDGRIFGHLADWDGCHTGFSNICVPPFQSESDFAYFNVGEIVCSDGTAMPVGKLMFSREKAKGHAPTDPQVGVREASKYYDDSTKIGGFVRAGADRFGTWLAGVLRSDLSEADLQILRANPPSGDWRPIPGKGSELVAAFCVPVPGFPIPRSLVASAADGLTIITGPLQVTEGPRARMRRRAMLRARLKEVA